VKQIEKREKFDMKFTEGLQVVEDYTEEAAIKEQLKVNEQLVEEITTLFLKDEVEKFGFKKVALTISGGVDSAVVLEFAVRAFGEENVYAVFLPHSDVTSKLSFECVEHLRDKFPKVNWIELDVKPIVERFETLIGLETNRSNSEKLRRGNITARVRMTVLFDIASANEAVVLGGSNKTELLLGYATWYGDMAAAIYPVGDLYKTQVFQMARYFKTPQKIIDRTPTAELWIDQEDEAELGIGYEVLDQILFEWIDLRRKPRQLYEKYGQELVNKVVKMVKQASFKRNMPLIPKYSLRTIGFEFRMPRDVGV